ncbi:alpha/beta hydrolase [Microbacterium sp. LWS13-1.2]|uniref:Alpha/beta hydrolase n=1 Tax=Microbacterium sp. LWS13-1.2 TaxID=3135264 RepID=A0AAU6S8R4_9MICO
MTDPLSTPAPAHSAVLVHGAYADGSSWQDVIPLLLRAGLQVAAVQNPLTSLADDVAATRRAIALVDPPTVLVGHSWAGTVITEAGIDDRVSALVYIAARAPDAGEDYSALAARFPMPPATAGLVHTDGFARLSEAAFIDDFANGIDAERARVLYAVQGAISDALFPSRTTVAAWRVRPTYYSVSTQDRTTAPELERFLAQRMQAQVIEIDSGHLAMVSHPQDVARLILAASARMREAE